ncbi:hypothetical protein KSP39_PZI007496 [Platanthera zijinensis]|uniref:Uncharacterized protein n=1 Tax=Platanthera zijinensis TaxID=2320716 RepID=A0AAP0G9U4_9ASPA
MFCSVVPPRPSNSDIYTLILKYMCFFFCLFTLISSYNVDHPHNSGHICKLLLFKCLCLLVCFYLSDLLIVLLIWAFAHDNFKRLYFEEKKNSIPRKYTFIFAKYFQIVETENSVSRSSPLGKG